MYNYSFASPTRLCCKVYLSQALHVGIFTASSRNLGDRAMIINLSHNVTSKAVLVNWGLYM